MTVTPRVPDISVVIPVFNEEENVGPLAESLTAALAGEDAEIIFVDDGSSDGCREKLRSVAKTNPRVKLVLLSRNFGHQRAITAGLQYSRGRAVIVMDGDGQDPPEVLPEFIKRWREGYQVVYGVRGSREEGVLKRIAYASFYRILRSMSAIDIPLDSGDFGLMDRFVVDTLLSFHERSRFHRGLRAWVGFRQVGVPYARHARLGGRPKYSVRQLFRLARDGVFSFSHVPLSLITFLGFIVSLSSFLSIILIVCIRLFTDKSIPGFASTASIMLFLGGVQLLSLGVVGEYVGRIFDEVKRRPAFLVSSTVNIDEPERRS